ncbi:hypothetical protein NBRC10512_007293 [Rhodotorula toruloides]|uniref:RNA-directed RNA polymerase n=1 Tax=Rhodotorula toruloides (strain NP11) TaxID=1130832 RepID=M7WPY1_RHOT1|nr:RNA-directed RNA polymerase [Rhodotorula toruloides NP11]EMS19925.1 RNA-directed RNA polymerase [Rhodotorula toruloides NP11]
MPHASKHLKSRPPDNWPLPAAPDVSAPLGYPPVAISSRLGAGEASPSWGGNRSGTWDGWTGEEGTRKGEKDRLGRTGGQDGRYGGVDRETLNGAGGGTARPRPTPPRPPDPLPSPAPSPKNAAPHPPLQPPQLPGTRETRPLHGPFLPQDLFAGQNKPRVRLDPDWQGFPVEKLYLGALDEREFAYFAVQRDAQIQQGLLEIGLGDGKTRKGEVNLSGYAFEGFPGVKISFSSGSLSRIYCAPYEGNLGADDNMSDFERIALVLETRWTPKFFAYYSSGGADNKVTGQVRVNALEATHSRLLPYLSRHFFLVLKLPRDKALVGEPSTRFSFRDFLKTCQDVHLPAVVQLASLPPVIEAEKRYSRKALRQLRRALSTISPSIAYHIEGIARDLSMTPLELERLVELHIKPWEATFELKDATIEEIVIELRTKLLEDRKALAELLQLGRVSPKDLQDVVFDIEQQAEEARQVVLERAEVDLTGAAAAAKKKKGTPSEHIWCRSIIYTPSGTIRVGGRILEKSNAVLRKYYGLVDHHQESDHFLRVTFRDEDEAMLLPSSGAPQDKLLQGSVAKSLKDGISFAGRKFEFLAYSQSGLRDRMVWFVAPWQDEDKHGKARTINADTIRKRFGVFDKISHQPAKLGASQGFTSSHATETLHYIQIGAIPDIVEKDKNGVETTNHTDGAGTMSLEVRDQVWQALQMSGFRRDVDGAPPTVVQFRLGGSKGVLAVDNRLEGAQVKLRPSQDKFQGLPDLGDEGFCLNVSDAFTRPGLLRLNRPLISALDDLGISIETFVRYQKLAVDALAPSELETLKGALSVLHRFAFGGATRFKSLVGSLASLSGFVDSILHEEPFLRGALEVIRTRSLRDLKERARIPVPDSYVLVGVPDEDRALKSDQVYACLRFPEKPDEVVYLEGRILVTRSPSVDPGDLRILNAVGKLPEHLEGTLRMAGLENCIVLPTVGDRALASMMGGGDLDGDTYQVITLPDLIPLRTAEPRMHKGPAPLELDRPATIHDVADCFLNYLTNDTTGIIATTHLIVADKSPKHGFDPVCQKLADLHSTSVDAPKTGIVVPLDSIPKLKTKVRPDFLRKTDELEPKEGPQYYDSQRALGHLYRNIEDTGLTMPTCVVSPALGDGRSTSFRVLELRVERDIASLFDASPDILRSVVDSHRSTVAAVLNAFYAALHDLAIVHSLPRTDGRSLSEVEIFATASLQEVQRGEAARGNAVSAMHRQTARLVDWLEAQLTGPPVESQHTDVESLKLRYSAWRVAVEDGDEYDFGVKTARWVCLALVFEAMQSEEERRFAASTGASSAARARPASCAPPLARISASPRQTLPPGQPDRRPSVGSLDKSFGISSSSSKPLIPYSTRPRLSESTPPTSPAHSLAAPLPPSASPVPADPWTRELDNRKTPAQVVETADSSDMDTSSSEDDDQGLRDILASIPPFPASTGAPQRGPAHDDDSDSLASSADSDKSVELDEEAAERFRRQLEQEEIERDEAEARELLYQQFRRRQYLEGKYLPSQARDPVAYRKHRDDFMADDQGRADFQAAEQRRQQRPPPPASAAGASVRSKSHAPLEGVVDYFEQLAQEQRRREMQEIESSKAAGPLSLVAPSTEDWPPLEKASARPTRRPSTRPPPAAMRPPSPSAPYSPPILSPRPEAERSGAPQRGVDYFFSDRISPSPPRPPPKLPVQWNDAGWFNKSVGPATSAAPSSPPRTPSPRPPTPPPQRAYAAKGNGPFWAHFTDYDKKRYKSNQTGLAKLARYCITADGETFADAYGLGRPTRKSRGEPRPSQSGGGKSWIPETPQQAEQQAEDEPGWGWGTATGGVQGGVVSHDESASQRAGWGGSGGWTASSRPDAAPEQAYPSLALSRASARHLPAWTESSPSPRLSFSPSSPRLSFSPSSPRRHDMDHPVTPIMDNIRAIREQRDAEKRARRRR